MIKCLRDILHKYKYVKLQQGVNSTLRFLKAKMNVGIDTADDIEETEVEAIRL